MITLVQVLLVTLSSFSGGIAGRSSQNWLMARSRSPSSFLGLVRTEITCELKDVDELARIAEYTLSLNWTR